MIDNLNFLNSEEKDIVDPSLIENQSYFKNCWDWYTKIYLSPVFERTIILIGASILLIMPIILILTVKSSLPVKTNFTYTKFIEQNEVGDVLLRLKKLSNDRYADPQMSLAKYLISQYIFYYESRSNNSKFFITQNSFISKNSSYKIYNDFKSLINDSKLESGSYTVAQIKDFNFETNNPFSDIVIINCLLETIKDGKVVSSVTKKIQINFSISKIDLKDQKSEKIIFVVTKYDY